MIRTALSIAVLSAVMVSAASAQQYVYPAKGQSPEQQKSDEAACHTWAIQQTGFDPAQPAAAAPAAPPTTATGTTPGAGARGAARGAVVGAAVGGDTGTAAAAGAVAARGQSRRQNAAASQQAQQQQQATTSQGQTAYTNARGACLSGRGYTVK